MWWEGRRRRWGRREEQMWGEGRCGGGEVWWGGGRWRETGVVGREKAQGEGRCGGRGGSMVGGEVVWWREEQVWGKGRRHGRVQWDGVEWGGVERGGVECCFTML